MRVQRLVMPWDAVSWTVLGDDGAPVGAVDRFLAFLSSAGKSPNTVKSYAHDLKDWFCYLSVRDVAWDEVVLKDVGSFVAWLRLPPQGWDGTVAVLSDQAYHCGGGDGEPQARGAGVVLSVPCAARREGGRGAAGDAGAGPRLCGDGFPPVPVSRYEEEPAASAGGEGRGRPLPRVLTVAEAQAVLDACGHLPDRLLLGMLPDTGRIGEALWATPAGRPMTYPAAYDLVTRLRAATGIAFSPHWFRHTCATLPKVSRIAHRPMITASRASRRSTGTTLRRRAHWCRPW